MLFESSIQIRIRPPNISYEVLFVLFVAIKKKKKKINANLVSSDLFIDFFQRKRKSVFHTILLQRLYFWFPCRVISKVANLKCQ